MMYLKHILLTVLLTTFYALHVDAKYATTTKDPQYPPTEIASEPFLKYATTTMKILAFNAANNQTWTATFNPRIDEFAQLEVAGTVANEFIFNEELYIQVVFPEKDLRTSQRRVYNATMKLYVPYFTVVLSINKGVVSQIAWVDSCSDCINAARCIDNNCGTEWNVKNKNICELNTNTTGADCNIKVYVAWYGTDNSDNSMTSISSIPSNFKKYSYYPLARLGLGLWDDFYYQFTQEAPRPLPGQDLNTRA